MINVRLKGGSADDGGREMSLLSTKFPHHEIGGCQEETSGRKRVEIIYHRPPASPPSLEVQGKEIGGGRGGGGRVGLKCENKYWRESKKIGKESGMETRPRRGFLCGRIYPSPPLPSPRRGKHGPWSRGMYNKNTRKERCFPGIKILYPPRV